MNRFTIALVAFTALCLPAATIQKRSGDIRTYVAGLSIPGAGSQGFKPPSASDITAWRGVVDQLFTGQFQAAADQADGLGYNVVQFADTVRSRTFYVLEERTSGGAPLRGLGTYIYNPSACRRLAIHAPHPGSDANTRPQAIALFSGLNATAFLLAGTERCANSTVSTCDGTTDACGDGKFHNSDVAHNTVNFFQPAHEEILAKFSGITTLAIHGEGSGGPDVIVSNGTCSTYPSQSVAGLVASEFSRQFQQVGAKLTATTCAPGNSTSLCAEVDVQGRYANGSTTLCNCAAPSASSCSTTLACARNLQFPEKFIHVEQTCAVRGVSSCSPPKGVDYDMAVAVFANVFPCSPTIGALLHGASFKADPLAPGSFFTLFGDGLGTAEQAGATAAFRLGGIQVQICGAPARLVFNSGAGQINGVVPIAAAGKNTCAVSVSSSASSIIPLQTATATIPVAAQNIAIFPYAYSADLTVPIITNANYQLIGPVAPTFVKAKKGEVLLLWTTGGGLTNPQVADAQAAPATGAPMLAQPSVRVAGLNAQVAFAGLAPGFTGLYQINIVVPPSTPSGKVTLTIASGIGDVNYDLYVE